jgi:hypothetical protein
MWHKEKSDKRDAHDTAILIFLLNENAAKEAQSCGRGKQSAYCERCLRYATYTNCNDYYMRNPEHGIIDVVGTEILPRRVGEHRCAVLAVHPGYISQNKFQSKQDKHGSGDESELQAKVKYHESQADEARSGRDEKLAKIQPKLK